METYFSEQAIAFLWSVVLGGAVGAVFDVFRILRILRRKNPWILVFLEDLLFCFIAAVASAYVFSRIYYGQVRLFLLMGQGLGFLIYRLTLGSLIGALARAFARLLHLLGKKLKLFLSFLKKPFIFLKEWCRIKLYYFGRSKRLREKQGKVHQEKQVGREGKALP